MLKRALRLAFVTLVSAPVVLGAPVFGAECLGVKVPDSVKAGGTDLVLNGLGIRKATFLKVKVYVAGLYLPQKSGDAGKIIGAWSTPCRRSPSFRCSTTMPRPWSPPSTSRAATS